LTIQSYPLLNSPFAAGKNNNRIRAEIPDPERECLVNKVDEQYRDKQTYEENT
jgi:hypothetical protein